MKLDELFHRFRTTARRRMGRARSVEQVRAATGAMQREQDAVFSELALRLPTPIACQPGCSYCCYLEIEVRPDEAFLIAEHLRRNRSRRERQAVLEKARANAARLAPLNAEQKETANLACPLLQEGLCTVYDVRPSACRAFHAQMRGLCRRSFKHPEDLDSPQSQVPEIRKAMDVVEAAIVVGMMDCGFDVQPKELSVALAETLSQPKLEQAWLDRATKMRANLSKERAAYAVAGD